MSDIKSLVANLRDHANTPRTRRSEDRTDALMRYAADTIALMDRSGGDALGGLPHDDDDDPPCTCCDGTGINYQTERVCACQPAPKVGP